ncbi:sensor histidine kinase [Bacteroides sp. 214]|uniref:sensor histidine kinase n=1 Tax=Bacteroides sp. 214 TaxID=2302935 RepID=UPI0013D01B08|nr:HAMP domain-containing sensor histidine kinase [Bacteroides sp. 214]NDW11424.1 sensor histidine kinase [Bacteroides sp. 214]
MNRFILIITIIIGIQLSAYSAQTNNNIDSLENLIKTLPVGDTLRLSLYNQLAIIKQGTPEGIQTVQQWMNEAERMKNDYYKCRAAYFGAIYYYNRQQTDSTLYYANILEPIAEELGLWDLYFEVQMVRNNLHIFDENFELSINNALRTQEKAMKMGNTNGIITAKTSLATAYSSTGRWEEGKKELEEAYKLLPKEENSTNRLHLLGVLVMASYHTNDYNKMMEYNTLLKEMLDKHIAETTFSESYNNIYAFVEIYNAYYYLKEKNDLSKALVHIKKADELINENSFYMYKGQFYELKATFYCKTKEYTKSLESIDIAINILKEAGLEENSTELLSTKAKILAEAGNYSDAIAVYQFLAQRKDSLSYSVSNKQMVQIQEIYNVNKLMMEQEIVINQRQQIVLASIATIFALLLAFIIRAFIVRRSLKASKEHVKEAMKASEETNEIKNRFLSNMSYNIRTPLNNVVGFSQLIAADPDMEDEQRKEYAAIIKKNSDELMRLVNDVLDLSRLESGMMKYTVSEYEISNLCNDALYMANSKNKGLIQINIEKDPQQEINVQTDSTRFIGALLSLFTYSNEEIKEERTITVKIKLSKDHKNVLLEVLNTPLADPELQTQEIIIRNEINRMFFERFRGVYKLIINETSGPSIVISHPLQASE